MKEVVLVDECNLATDENLVLDVGDSTVVIKQGIDTIFLSIEEAEKLTSALDILLTEREARNLIIQADDLPEYV